MKLTIWSVCEQNLLCCKKKQQQQNQKSHFESEKNSHHIFIQNKQNLCGNDLFFIIYLVNVF